MLRSSVQMVMLTAPDVRAAAAFYVEHLGFRSAAVDTNEAIVEGYGMQIVFSPGPGGTHELAP
jgi:catechol 2,3-dioxygenase-like lactoylglutathione lyase family enzyme